MTHIDEHILELYVLGSEKVKSQRREVEEHLLVCHGCRALVEKIRRFYADADEEFKSLEKAQPETTTALVRKRLEVTPYEEWISPRLPRYPVTRFERFQRIIRRHPVVTGAGSFAAVAVAATLINLLAVPNKDANPMAYRYNSVESKIEIYNREGDKLWSIGCAGLQATKTEDPECRRRTVVADLDANGANEVVTTNNLLEDQEDEQPPLRVFAANRELRVKKTFDPKFTYLNRLYSSIFNPIYLLVMPIGTNRTEEIFVTLQNHGRSPSFVARLDRHGNDIGRYWHFGGLVYAMDTVNLLANSQKAIVVCGENDTADSTGGEFAAFAVLDPIKITGDKKSTASPGFGFESSDAELYYVKLPTTDVDVLLSRHPVAMRVSHGGSGIFSVFAAGGDPGEAPPSFYYYFSSDMHVVDVKSDDPNDHLFRNLYDQGKISSKINREYLENLKNGVRYWDGKQWRKEVVRVNHE